MDKSEEDSERQKEEQTGSHGLPHWTESGTGQMPAVSNNDPEPSDTWSSLSDGPQWADDPVAVEKNPVIQESPRVDLTIGDDSKSEDFFSYERTPDLAETTESIISEGKKSRRSGMGSRETITRIFTGVVLAGIVILCLAISKLVTVILIS
ncbi:MAG: hypothetical protein L7S58_04485, partial [Acidimicrobiales bacterium]|nr:hypothetical protein [Acidimicrobiales bacterium]